MEFSLIYFLTEAIVEDKSTQTVAPPDEMEPVGQEVLNDGGQEDTYPMNDFFEENDAMGDVDEAIEDDAPPTDDGAEEIPKAIKA